MLGIMLAVAVGFAVRYFWPEWPEYVQLIVAFQTMIFFQVVANQWKINEVQKYFGVDK